MQDIYMMYGNMFLKKLQTGIKMFAAAAAALALSGCAVNWYELQPDMQEAPVENIQKDYSALPQNDGELTCNGGSQIDIKALKIELKANNFYRGNPYVLAIGSLLGFSEEQLDKFFKDGNYEHLLV